MIDNKESIFRIRNLGKHLQSLRKEIIKIKEEIIKCLEIAETNPQGSLKINNTLLSSHDLMKACLIILRDEPSHMYFTNYEWLATWNAFDIISVFNKLENYLRQIPGAHLPEKDQTVQEWFEKIEKLEKEKGDEK